MQDEASKPLPSIRSQIALLVLACALPALAALLLFIVHINLSPPPASEQQLARAVAVSIDRQLQAIESSAAALAVAPGLKLGDYSGFHSQASALLRLGFPVEQILLSDASGQVLATTSLPLPRAANAQRLKPLFASGRTTLTRLAPSTPAPRAAPAPSPATRASPAGATAPAATATATTAAAGAPFALDVPIVRAGKPALAVTMLLPAGLLDSLLASQSAPPGLAARLLDASNQPISHSASAGAASGIGSGIGNPRPVAEIVEATYLRAVDAPWSITVSMPAATTQASETRFLLLLSAAIALIVLAGFVLAWSVAGRISRSIRALTIPARALAAGAPITIEPMAFREAEEVGKALQQVEQDLSRHRHGLEQQVQERTRQLEDNNALLETICATAPVGLSFVDTQLNILMINDYLAALNGMPASAHLGKRFDELIPDPALLASVNDAYRRVLASGQPVTGIEFGGRTVSRPERDSSLVASYHPVFGADGRMVGITGLLVDMSDQKAIEAQLRESKQLFKSVLENLPAVVFVKEAHSLRYQLLNRLGERFFGRRREEVLGKNDAQLFPPDLAASFEEADRQVLASGEELVLKDEEVRSPGGEQHWMTTRKVALRDEHGHPAHLLGISLDITERKRADAALLSASQRLERNNEFLHTVTDNLPGIVAYWDAELRCHFANKFFLDWFRKSKSEAIGAHMSRLLPAFLIDQIKPQLDAVLAGRPQNFANEIPQPNGDVRYGWTNLIPDIDEHGTVRGFYALASDVTELKRSELRLQELNEQLVRARDRAEAASSAKSEFVANMSHEIRTPMNAIIGLARLLEEAPLERRERSYVGKIQTATKSLLGVVNDVLDFSKIEAGQLRLEQARFNLEHMLSNTAMLVAGSAWDKGVEPVFDIAPGLPRELIGDAMRLHQVLLNLLSNAVKFTEHGEVVLGVREAGRDGSVITLEFYVHDTGIGIAADQQLRMFDAFSQGDSSTSRKYGGTGLGLAISRRLVDLMGGVISVHSTPGQGSTFRFVCPLLCAPGQAADAVPPGLHGLRVLAVDDNRSVLHALEHAGDAMGWAVWLCGSAAEGLHTLRTLHNHGQKLDLLMIDSAMPGNDGISMLVEARGIAGLSLPRVVMMASEQSAEDLRQLADSLLIDAVLAKPCTHSQLRAAVLEALTGSAPVAARTETTPLAGRLAGMRVLLVEDNEINQEMARYILTHADARVEIAGNGAIAVEMLRALPGRADAVLMDLQMPVMNGYEATAAIRAMGLDGLPVIAMTANAMHEDRQRAIAAGVNAHIAKPIDVDELIATLISVTSMSGVTSATSMSSATGVASGTNPASPACPANPANASSAAAAAGATSSPAERPGIVAAALAWRTGAPASSRHGAGHGGRSDGDGNGGSDGGSNGGNSSDSNGGNSSGSGGDGSSANWGDVDGIDLDAALARMGGNRDAFVSLLKRFEHSQGASISEIRQWLRQDKPHAADQVLHRLKGVAANLGARDIADLCAQAQSALADGDDDSLQALMQTLDSAIARLIATARALPEPARSQAGIGVSSRIAANSAANDGGDAAGRESESDGGGGDDMAGGGGSGGGRGSGVRLSAAITASHDTRTLDASTLADFLSLLKNSNMRAISSHKAVRSAIEAAYPDLAPALTKAVDTLDFTAAEHLVKEMLKRREWA